MAVARGRLTLERKNWRRDHPFGFVAKPLTNPDGSTDMMKWQCKVPGKEGTIWEGGLYPVEMTFPEDYPTLPPTCKFPAGFFHPNVYDSGAICLSIINADADWAPSITVKQILLGIQELLTNPNIHSAAQRNAYTLYKTSQTKYIAAVKAQAQKYAMQD